MSPGGFGGGVGPTTTTMPPPLLTTFRPHPPTLALAEEQTASGLGDLEITKPRKNKFSLRSHFPENWLFDFVSLSETAATHLR